MMIKESLRKDSTQKTLVSNTKIINGDSVRSIQRLPSVPTECHWVMKEYMKWLPTFFPFLIKVDNNLEKNTIEFRFSFLKKPLLILEEIKDSSNNEREKFHIIGGLLSRTTNTGWLEFRQIENKKYLIASIHEFFPSLPWMIYVMTQAPLHKFVMIAFGKHLKKHFETHHH